MKKSWPGSRAGSTGVVTHREAIASGVTARQIEYRIRRGLLIPQFRGVYRVGHAAPSLDAHHLAAVRACGERAVVFRRSAAYLLGLTRQMPPEPEVLVLSGRLVRGVYVRRTRAIDRRDVAIVKSIPVTTVPRTLVDLAAVLDEEALARACHEAWVRHRVGRPRIEKVLARCRVQRGGGACSSSSAATSTSR